MLMVFVNLSILIPSVSALSANSISQSNSGSLILKGTKNFAGDPAVPTATCDGSQYTGSTPYTNNIIFCRYIKPAINFLSAGVGIVVIIMIIIGAIQYTTSSGNPQTLADGRKKIINAVIALVAFGLLYGFLNFLIPGGLLPI